MTPDNYLNGEVIATLNVYGAECTLLMPTYISFHTIIPAICLMSETLTGNKYQGTLGYQMKNDAADLGNTVLNLI